MAKKNYDGWVVSILDHAGVRMIVPYTFEERRSAAIETFLECWEGLTWREARRVPRLKARVHKIKLQIVE